MLPPTAEGLEAAADALRAGQVVVVPTDTVYGVAVDPTQPGATGRLFEAKQRPRGVALPVLVSGPDQLTGLVEAVPAHAARLMARFWPGGLTIVLARRPGLALDLGDDEATVGVRCADHPVPAALCRSVGPMATTSANLHGRPTPATAGEVAAELGASVGVVIDGGPCSGAPSTVVDCTGSAVRLLREGRVPWSAVAAVAGEPG